MNLHGKTDIQDVPFRDRVVERAVARGFWGQDHVWMIPEQDGIYGERYIVVSGMYTPQTLQFPHSVQARRPPRGSFTAVSSAPVSVYGF